MRPLNTQQSFQQLSGGYIFKLCPQISELKKPFGEEEKHLQENLNQTTRLLVKLHAEISLECFGSLQCFLWSKEKMGCWWTAYWKGAYMQIAIWIPTYRAFLKKEMEKDIMY